FKSLSKEYRMYNMKNIDTIMQVLKVNLIYNGSLLNVSILYMYSIHEKTQEAVNVEEDVAQLCDGLISGTKFSDGTVGSLEALGGEISKGDL
ncbi:hypothetical protein scyTo_0024997, partial [Scyliorhinus torazame]|nr:hypothetical protein [Scyliorhinus torazame]